MAKDCQRLKINISQIEDKIRFKQKNAKTSNKLVVSLLFKKEFYENCLKFHQKYQSKNHIKSDKCTHALDQYQDC